MTMMSRQSDSTLISCHSINKSNKSLINHVKLNTASLIDNNIALPSLIGTCKVQRLKGDGHCIYRAFAIEIYGNESTYMSARNDCADMMVTN